MATKLFLHAGSQEATYGFSTNLADAVGTARGWDPLLLDTVAGGSTSGGLRATVAGPTVGLEIWFASPVAIDWFSEPLAADITISGTVTFNIWAYETNMSANVCMQVIIEQIGPTGTITQIVNSERGTEVAVSTINVGSLNNWTAAPTSRAMKRGDRIRVRVLANDITSGTMASGFSFGVNFDGPVAGVDGDTWIQFTENLTFESNAAGTTMYLTDTASDVATASVDREAWTSRGSGVLDDVTNTVAGWTAPIQVTDTAGGTAVDWYTRRLNAFTLGGKVTLNLRAKESSAGANASITSNIAICDADGSNPVIWAQAPAGSSAQAFNELATTDAQYICWPAGPNTSVAAGQRLRIRLFIDDIHSQPIVAGQTATITYNGVSGGVAGDAFMTLQQTVTEFVPAAFLAARAPHVRQAVNRAGTY